MAGYSQGRGYVAEKYCVDLAEEHGVPSRRAWSSNGQSMGLEKGDDGLIGWYRWQSKRFKWKNVVKWFLNNVVQYLSSGQDIVTIYIDKAPGHPRKVYVVQEYESWLKLKRMATLYGKQNKEDDNG